MDMNQRVEASQAEREKAKAGPNWLCEYCGGSNRAAATTCASCGAAKTEDQTPGYNRVYRSNQDFAAEPEPDGGQASNIYGQDPTKTPAYLKARKKRRIKDFFIVAFVLAAFVVLFPKLLGLFEPQKNILQIDHYVWENEIRIEELQTFEESDWSMPIDARLIETRQEVHHYNQTVTHYETKYRTVQVIDRYETKYKTVEVIDYYETKYRQKEVLDGYDEVSDGVRDLGNGYFEEITRQVPRYRTVDEPYQVPVYKTVKEPYQEPVYKDVQEAYESPVYREDPVYQDRYYYEIDRYAYTRSIYQNGIDTEPDWDTPDLKDTEREAGRTAVYALETTETTKEGIKKQMYTIDVEVWKTLMRDQVRELECRAQRDGSMLVISSKLPQSDIFLIPVKEDQELTGNGQSAGTAGIAGAWQQQDGDWYYADQNGNYVTGWLMLDGSWYYLNEDGSMATGWIQLNDKHYFLQESGSLLTDGTTPDGYYVNQNGEWEE